VTVPPPQPASADASAARTRSRRIGRASLTNERAGDPC
jgi:hypothetical protein